MQVSSFNIHCYVMSTVLITAMSLCKSGTYRDMAICDA